MRFSSGHGERRTATFCSGEPRRTVHFAQHRVADAGELVGERASGLVVVACAAARRAPMSQAIDACPPRAPRWRRAAPSERRG